MSRWGRFTVLRKSFVALALAGALSLSFASSATAADGQYPPDAPTAPSLAGSAVVASCGTGGGVVSYDVVLTDPDGVITSYDASLTLTDGSHSTSIALGTVASDGTLSGSVAWPDVSWARDITAATITAGSSVQFPLSAPTSGSCGTGAAGADASSSALAVTGVAPGIAATAIGGGALVVLGGVLLVRRRRRV